ncbi:PepSY domain-containing protein [Oceanobacillus luteolus]|uniref:PepSY domain-containing protein n=1 Tax=Oceanobacillus luteolus TaxID=1274358 RepID=UPI00203A9FFD|nr:PepSY domain-containing protein [Oceanobacillus luteolus]MCM3741241.1 PepSY domain-containing protein [Oceanobacillus luteolus]
MKKILVTGIVTAGILLGGASIIGASTNDSNEANMEDKAVQAESVAKTANVSEEKNLLSSDKIKEIALSEQDGHIDDIELESEDGFVYYEVDIENGEAEYDIYIEAYTGEVLKVEADDNDDDKENETMKNIISAAEAKKIAIDQVGGKVVEFDLDEDDNRYEYEIELETNRGEVEMTIDALTGEILEVDFED